MGLAVGDRSNIPFAYYAISSEPVLTDDDSFASVRSRAYEKLREAISDRSAWAVNLAEYHQSFQMMTARLQQLLLFTKAIRKKDLVAAKKALGFTGSPLRRGVPKTLADHWLEYSFGWKPLFEDIYSGMQALQTPIKSIRPRGKFTESLLGISGSNSGGFISTQEVFGKRFCKQGCEVTISNPLLYLANNLGIVNPAVVAWELIPFSFVVDWFVNVEQFLSSGTDYLGLTVSKPWTVFGLKGRVLVTRDNPFWTPRHNAQYFQVAYVKRTTDLSNPLLFIRPARLWGWQRCFNAASVLTQSLKGLR
jgi:hypothetical protein